MKFKKFIDYLAKKKSILLLTTSNRWNGDKETPKSTLAAEKIAEIIGKDKVKMIDTTRLKIYHCEGNISTHRGNSCGLRSASLKDKGKNPTGNHRCWASINNKDDELWKISKDLFDCDCVLFFGSVRWGQMNAYYQKLIERLTWIENRHATLKEDNIVSGIDAGIIIVGHNWRGKEVLEVQKQVLSYFGFNLIDDLCWNWQYTDDPEDESEGSYKNAAIKFNKDVLSKLGKDI